jgi:hypothetical protein
VSYIAFDLDALNEAPAVARFAGVSEDLVIAGMARMWAWCFREKVDIATTGQVRGLFGTDLTEALTEFGYLEPDEHADGHWRVRGADRYLRVAEGRSKGGKAAAASGNLKRGTKRDVEAVVARMVEVQAQLTPSTAPSSSPAGSQLTPRLSPSTEHRAPNTEEAKDICDQRVDQLRRAWNELTSKPLPRWEETPKHRAKAAIAALKRRPLDEWRTVFRIVEASPFCRGESGGSWKADIDWTIRPAGQKPEPALKLLEGAYSGKGSTKGPAEYDGDYWANKPAIVEGTL